MKTFINFQNDYVTTTDIVHNAYEFQKWAAANLTDKTKLYVVLPGKETREVLITRNRDDIVSFFSIKVNDIIFIQEFNVWQYKEALRYLSDLFEAREPGEIEINKMYKN